MQDQDKIKTIGLKTKTKTTVEYSDLSCQLSARPFHSRNTWITVSKSMVSLDWLSAIRYMLPVINPPPSVWPHLFRGAGHEKRRGEQWKWSLACRLYIGSFPCAQLPGPVHTARFDRVCFIFSLGLWFVYLYCFKLFVCPHPFVFP